MRNSLIFRDQFYVHEDHPEIFCHPLAFWTLDDIKILLTAK